MPLPEGRSYNEHVEATGLPRNEALTSWDEHTNARRASIASIIGITVDELHTWGQELLNSK